MKLKETYDEISIQRNFRMANYPYTAKVPAAKFPYGEVSLRRNILKPMFPYGEFSHDKNFATAKFAAAKIPSAVEAPQ